MKKKNYIDNKLNNFLTDFNELLKRSCIKPHTSQVKISVNLLK